MTKKLNAPALNAIKQSLVIEPIADEAELRGVMHAAAVADYRLRAAELELDTEIAEIRLQRGGNIEALKTTAARLVSRLKAWCVANRASFGKRQSRAIDGHELVFRKSPGAVAILHGAKADDILDGILASGNEDIINACVAIKPSLDKDGIKRLLRAGGDAATLLSNLGLEIQEPETFEFKPAAVSEE